MNPIDCDVLVVSDDAAGLVAAIAAAKAGACTMLVATAMTPCEDTLFVAILREQARLAGVRQLDGDRLVRVVRHGRSIVSATLERHEISARFFVDATRALDLLRGTGAAIAPIRRTDPIHGEFIDTIAIGEAPGGRRAVPYRDALSKDLDNALAAGGTLLIDPLALAAAHALGTAAALLSASGQPARLLDPATLRERLRAAGARF